MSGQQVHGQCPPGTVQQVGGERQHCRSLRLFSQQLNPQTSVMYIRTRSNGDGILRIFFATFKHLYTGDFQ